MNTPQEKVYNSWQYPKYFSRCRAYRPLALSQNSKSQLTKQQRAACRIWQVWGFNLTPNRQTGKQPTFQELPRDAVSLQLSAWTFHWPLNHPSTLVDSVLTGCLGGFLSTAFLIIKVHSLIPLLSAGSCSPSFTYSVENRWVWGFPVL